MAGENSWRTPSYIAQSQGMGKRGVELERERDFAHSEDRDGTPSGRYENGPRRSAMPVYVTGIASGGAKCGAFSGGGHARRGG